MLECVDCRISNFNTKFQASGKRCRFVVYMAVLFTSKIITATLWNTATTIHNLATTVSRGVGTEFACIKYYRVFR
jgi:hypothetical protein